HAQEEPDNKGSPGTAVALGGVGKAGREQRLLGESLDDLDVALHAAVDPWLGLRVDQAPGKVTDRPTAAQQDGGNRHEHDGPCRFHLPVLRFSRAGMIEKTAKKSTQEVC